MMLVTNIRFSDSEAILPCGLRLPLTQLRDNLHEVGDDLGLSGHERVWVIALYLSEREFAERDSRLQSPTMLDCGRRLVETREPTVLQ